MRRLFLKFLAILKREKIQGNTRFSEQIFLPKTVIACRLFFSRKKDVFFAWLYVSHAVTMQANTVTCLIIRV